MSDILINNDGEVTIAVPNKRLDTTNADDAIKLFEKTVEAGARLLVVDFSKTDYVSSAGLRALLKTAKVMKAKSGQLALCCANEQIHEVLGYSGFLNILNYYDSLETAVQGVRQSSS